jgi:hypothetical protein
MRPTIFLLFCLLGLLSACATGPTTSVVWTKAGVQAQQKAIDTQICTANGYQVAGPRPVPQAAPACSTPGFACGFAQGSVAASNGAAMGSWKAAFQSGFDSCMYDKGYFQTTITN